ncbi:hypothetical protein CD928_19075 [Sphingopyxis sp. GW247-27LB]|nr:MAG: hypothetical protein A3E77_03690 [Sphingopyxis sp. RIFCSPHIGHO2_12_FULL_65_19]PAL20473.1 hypothetical protein CD928_19075 [Sphingopyxis sp. GW247-27LB]
MEAFLMKKPHIDLQTRSSTSARELLEKYLYGSGDVELILRFAEEHNLEKDNLVWLLTGILKVGSNLVNDLLRATQYTGEVIAVAETQRRTSMQDAEELAGRLVAQISTAASQSAGQLDMRIAKIERLGRDVSQLAAHFASAHGEFKYTRDSFQKFIETEMRVWAIEFLARAREQLNPQPWRLYTISAVQTALIIGLLIWR